MNKKYLVSMREEKKETYGDPSIDSCIALWESVLEFAWHESFIRADKPIFRDQAHHWFVYRNDDFSMICDLIGYHPEAIREKFMKSYVKKFGKKP